jgi:hypothetical protein
MSNLGSSDSDGSISISPLRHLIEISDPVQAQIISSAFGPCLDILTATVQTQLPYYLPEVFKNFSGNDLVTAFKILPGATNYMCVIMLCQEFQTIIPYGLSVSDSIKSFTSRLNKDSQIVIQSVISSLKINVPLGPNNIYNKEVYTRLYLQALLGDLMSQEPISNLLVGKSMFQIGPLVVDSVDSVLDNFNTEITPYLSEDQIISYFTAHMNDYFLPKATEYFLRHAPQFLGYPKTSFKPEFPSTNDPLLNKFLNAPQSVLSPGEQIATDIFSSIFSELK